MQLLAAAVLLDADGCLLGAVVAGSAIKIAVAAFPSAFCGAERRAPWARPRATSGAGPDHGVRLRRAATIVALAVLAVALLDYSLHGQDGEREEGRQ